MGVVYIGDRTTGKTSLAMELIGAHSDFVRVSNISSQKYQQMKALSFDPDTNQFLATKVDPNFGGRLLEVEVRLPSGRKTVSVDWVDTAGGVWQKSWAGNNPQLWDTLLTRVRSSEGIMLILPPYREIIHQSSVDHTLFPTQKQWCKRFRRWVEFFRSDCPRVRHIVVCLNKADLFCDLEREAGELAYNRGKEGKGWYGRSVYVSRRYFSCVQKELENMNSVTSVRYFLTSIHHRGLLELPWIYLASHLA